MRNRIISLMMAVAMAIALTACGEEDESKLTLSSAQKTNTSSLETDTNTKALIEQVEGYAHDMVNGEFDTIAANFSDSIKIKNQLTAQQLKQAWDMTTEIMGAYSKLHKTTASAHEKGVVIEAVIKFEKGALSLTISYDKDQRIDGVWLKPTDIAEAESSDEFSETAIRIGKEPLMLDGMLTQPAKDPVKAVVILVHGSGQSGMNEAVGENRPFQDIAHGLAEQGIASIRYNKRYFQYPEKAVPQEMTVDKEVLEDVGYAIDFVVSNESLKDYRIYIAGHSMGGMLAPKLALDNDEVDGFISLAGSPRRLIDIMYDQNLALIDSLDKTKEEKAALISAIDEQYELAKAVKADSPQAFVFSMPSQYIYSLNSIDTPAIARQLDIPMMFMQGTADFQVYADVDFKQWQTLLEGNEKAEFKLYEGLNHLFFKSKGIAGISDYDGENHVEQTVIDDMVKWVKAVM